jgi:hypothetical protein
MAWYHPLTPRGFLQWGGIVLALLGIVGFLNIFSDTSSSFYLDSAENVAHLGLGVIALAALYVPGLNTALAPYYKWIVALVGVIALFFAVYGFLQSGAPAPNTFGVGNLETPIDDLIHLVVGVWGLWAAFYPAKQETMGGYGSSM